jgi:hypothetical protein
MKNIGTMDRVLRWILSIVLLLAGTFVLEGWLAIVAYVLAGVFAATAVVRVCPLYMPLGLRTCPKE